MIRQPAVSGMFYYNDHAMLKKSIATFWPDNMKTITNAKGVMVPHAGYIYSGTLAARVFASLQHYDTYILVGPNHTGHGAKLSLSSAKAWQTPLGNVAVNLDLANQLVKQVEAAAFDDEAHKQEHSLEVQLPLLQYSGKPFDIVAITIRTWDDRELQSLGQGIAHAISQSDRKIVVVASTDMNHFENLKETERLDQLALQTVLELDPKGLMKKVLENDISMCGAAPTAVMLEAIKPLGAEKAELIGHMTSAEVSGDRERVVGYAGIVIK